MTTPQERIESDLKEALRAKDRERVSTLRMLLTEVNNERISRGDAVDDEAFASVVRKAIKKRHEAAEQFRKAGREESAAGEEREAEILEGYLPQQAGEDEIRRAVEELAEAEGYTGAQHMGPVMKQMMARFGATADGSVISRIAREVLAERSEGD